MGKPLVGGGSGQRVGHSAECSHAGDTHDGANTLAAPDRGWSVSHRETERSSSNRVRSSED
eukprot:11085982-Alexandrium_andersonii.AAC.1